MLLTVITRQNKETVKYIVMKDVIEKPTESRENDHTQQHVQ